MGMGDYFAPLGFMCVMAWSGVIVVGIGKEG